MRSTCYRAAALAVFAAGAWSRLAIAQTGSVEDRLRDQLRQTTLELRQAQDDSAMSKAKLEALSQQFTAQQAQAQHKKSEDTRSEELRRALSGQTTKAEALRQQLEETKTALAQAQTSYQQAAALAQARDADAKKFEALYQSVESYGKSCGERNAKLVQISGELLNRYKNKGVWDAIWGREPLTGLHRVELEKIAQDYHAAIVDATVPSPSPAPSPAAAAGTNP